MPENRGETRMSVLMLTLFCAMGIAPLIQFGLGALGPFLVADLGITRTQVGLLTSALFATSAVVALKLGMLVDRVDTHAALLALYAAGGLAVGLLAAARAYPWALVATAVAGAPMALANPATNLLVREVKERTRALLVGFKQAVVQAAGAIAGFVLPTIAVHYGWRVAVLTLAVVPAAGALLVFWVAPVTQRTPVVRPRARRASPAFVSRLAVYAGVLGITQAALPNYLPLYAVEALGFTPQAAGILLGGMGLAGMAARIGWARRIDRSVTVSVPLTVIAVAATLAVLLVAVAAETTGATLVAGALLFGASAPVWNVVAMLAILRDIPASDTGRATGVVYTGFSLGFVAGPALVGLTVDLTTSYVPGWLLCAGSCALGVLLAVRMGRA